MATSDKKLREMSLRQLIENGRELCKSAGGEPVNAPKPIMGRSLAIHLTSTSQSVAVFLLPDARGGQGMRRIGV